MTELKHYTGFDKMTFEESQGVLDVLPSDCGSTWGELKHTFRKDTWKVGYGANGGIWTINKDIDLVCMGGCRGVIEIEEIPEGYFEEQHTFYFDESLLQIVRDPIWYQRMHERRVMKAVTKLKQYEFEDMFAPKAKTISTEPTDFAMWMNYLFDLKQIDVTQLNHIVWPEQPKD